MGLFGKIFEKKSCSICNSDIGLLGNRKLEDGNLCKECAGNLSPFFSERRFSTVEQVREQLASREANKESVAAFNVTRTLGGSTKVLLDEDAQRFLVTSSSRWRDANPDVLEFSQVTGCDTEIRETRTEIYRRTEDGERESYDPPRYDIAYDMYLTLHVNTPYFDEITFKVNDYRIERQGSVEFNEAERQATEIRKALAQVREDARESAAAAKAPKMARTCPCCGATTVPDASGRCEYCGGAMNA
ncbi:hypothetical protein C1879_01595 [Paraeggerthella hongkongensis]|uniref:DUF4428 domain-containing protein n=1 Tax=Paraeggerthella sp. TaxID=2897350 RepID=UPI000DF81ABF|nr:hypothetical protein C1879_01595 [Paraeggerthella hongkongensis]